jgi:hypothetical protein
LDVRPEGRTEGRSNEEYFYIPGRLLAGDKKRPLAFYDYKNVFILSLNIRIISSITGIHVVARGLTEWIIKKNTNVLSDQCVLSVFRNGYINTSFYKYILYRILIYRLPIINCLQYIFFKTLICMLIRIDKKRVLYNVTVYDEETCVHFLN